jgi:hypothetical protein
VVNAEGCNDTLRLNLTINNGSLTEVTETACKTFTWTAGDGTTYTASGVYDYISWSMPKDATIPCAST